MNEAALGFHCFVWAVLGFVWLNSLGTLLVIRRLRPRTAPANPPLVSILVPARNEARRIVRCLRSLCAQNYPRFEVLLLDDDSTDNTRQLAEEVGFSPEGKFRLLTGEPLPPGWTGKSWACHQLARAAAGQYLLFTDADTEHAPTSVATALREARRMGASLLTVWPRQITCSLGEKAVVPLLYIAIVGMLPHFLLVLAQRFSRIGARLPRVLLRNLAAANGQFLLFRRADYLAIGGHAAVRHHLVEDVALSRLVALRIPEGFRLVNCDGSLLVRCRMYENLRETWDGFTKNCRAAFDASLATFLVVGAVQVAVFFVPFVLLSLPGKRWLALAEVLAILGLRVLYAWRFRGPLLSALLHPFGEIISLGIALNSWRLSAGRGVDWKGRHYQVVHHPPAASAPNEFRRMSSPDKSRCCRLCQSQKARA